MRDGNDAAFPFHSDGVDPDCFNRFKRVFYLVQTTFGREDGYVAIVSSARASRHEYVLRELARVTSERGAFRNLAISINV